MLTKTVERLQFNLKHLLLFTFLLKIYGADEFEHQNGVFIQNIVLLLQAVVLII